MVTVTFILAMSQALEVKGLVNVTTITTPDSAITGRVDSWDPIESWTRVTDACVRFINELSLSSSSAKITAVEKVCMCLGRRRKGRLAFGLLGYLSSTNPLVI